MKIFLKEDYTPSKISTARPIPFARREKVRMKLIEMEKKNIIAPLDD